MSKSDQLSVNEAGYSRGSGGPASDTEAYSKDTPAIAQRILHHQGHSFEGQSIEPRTEKATGNMPSIEITGDGGHPNVDDGRLPIPLILGVGAIMCMVAAVAFGVVFYLASPGATEEEASEPEIEEVMGVPVKKGFEKPDP